MKYQFITATMFCVALSACGGGGGDNDEDVGPFTPVELPPATNTGGVAETDPAETVPPTTVPPTTVPPVTQPPVTQPPVTQPPVSQPPVSQPPVSQPPVSQPPVSQPPIGGSSSQSEDQLLNQGTSQSPVSAWACSVPDDTELDGLLIVLGFYGQGDGIFGLLDPDSGMVFGDQTPYTFDASGNATFITPLDDGTSLTVVLAAPVFIDGTTFTSSIGDGVDETFPTTCALIEIGTDTGTGNQPELPTTGSGDLEAQLLNAGTQANPLGGWTCEGFLFGFYGSGQGRFGAGDNFNTIQYTVTSADGIELSDGINTGSLSSIQFTGPDNFSTTFFNGEDTLGIECTRRELSLAQADSRTSGLSLLKSMQFDKSLTVDQMPRL